MTKQINPELISEIKEALPDGEVKAMISLHSDESFEQTVNELVDRAEGESGAVKSYLNILPMSAVFLITCPASMLDVLISYDEISMADPIKKVKTI